MSGEVVQLTRELMIEGLRDLVARLAGASQHHAVYVVGGAAMNLRYVQDRRLTPDVDAQLSPPDGLLAAAHEVAEARGWDPEWLNNKAVGFIPIAKDAGWEPIHSDEHVSIYVASPGCLLAMKLRAARRGRDVDDISALLALCDIADIDAAEELFEEYYPGELPPDRAYRMLENLFAAGIPPAPPAPPRPDLAPRSRSESEAQPRRSVETRTVILSSDGGPADE